jgi:hypothetical protein
MGGEKTQDHKGRWSKGERAIVLYAQAQH